MHKLSLIVPCYNEEKNLMLFYSIVRGTFERKIKDYEIVFVNDGSHDGTERIFDEIINSNDDSNIKTISFSRNFGKEAAILAGLNESDGEYTCIIDADLQQDPALVVKMVDILENKKEVDCVAAFQEVRHEGAALSFFKDCFYKLINKISDTKLTQGASDFRVFRRNVKETVLSLNEYPRFSKGIFSWIGFNTKFIPYEVKPRNEGKSKWSFSKLFKYAIDGITAYTTAPLRMATYAGVISLMASFICFLIFLVSDTASRSHNMFGHTIIVLMLLLAGLQFIFTGIIGEYFARSYIQGKNRPFYIIKNKQRKERTNTNDKAISKEI